jgi:hypothetical protein
MDLITFVSCGVSLNVFWNFPMKFVGHKICNNPIVNSSHHLNQSSFLIIELVRKMGMTEIGSSVL